MLHVTPDCLADLGWPRILAALADCCATDRARAIAPGLPFLPDAATVRQTYAAVDELSRMLARDAPLPVTGLDDVRTTVDLCRRGGTAGVDELVATARTARRLGDLHRHLREHSEALPVTAAIAEDLADLGPLGDDLARTFDASGRIRDDASPDLRDARHRLAVHRQRIKERLDAWLVKPEHADMLQDDYYTERDDRYVVPIIASMQSQVPGIIHGDSQSGQTVFLEPQAFIAANNDIKLAASRVVAETRRVLIERSSWVAAKATDLQHALEVASELDLLEARARFAERYGGAIPEVATSGRLALDQARNPHLVLKGSKVIPNDIVLDDDHAFVLITGPNTGGKTVTLSTVGLSTLMVHAAIPLMAAPSSRAVLFEGLWALIGDPQDIQRDLSTFSGHILALGELLSAADSNSLVLLDELIVGTEPERGAALAIAVLEALADRGARGFVTTHYERLKLLAYEDMRFANASVGIDAKTLLPTWVLSMGEPGASSPFEIAERMGFDAGILERARAISVGDAALVDAVAGLREAEERADVCALAARAAEAAAETEAGRLQAARERLEAAADLEVAALRQQVREEAREALETIRAQVREVQRMNDPAELARRRKKVIDVEARVAPAEEAVELVPPSPAKAAASPAKQAATGPRDGGDLEAAPTPGQAVWVRTLKRPGEVVEARGREWLVAVGSLKISLPQKRLGRLVGVKEEAPSKKAPKPTVRVHDTNLNAEELVPPPRTDDITLDLRGYRRDEVRDQVDRFLDRAWREDREAVWIIHGHGTGAVRDEVRAALPALPYVLTSRSGRRHEGGDGVTLIWLERG